MLIHRLITLLLYAYYILQYCTKFEQPTNNIAMSKPRKRRDSCVDEKYRDMYAYFLKCQKDLGKLATQVPKQYLYTQVQDKYYFVSWRSVQRIILLMENEYRGKNPPEYREE